MATGKASICFLATAKIFIVALALTLLLGLSGTISVPEPATATPDEVKWSRVNIPIDGEAGNWVLAGGSNIQHLTMAIDGTLYCYVNPSGTSYTLFKSIDTGSSWSPTGKVTDTIADITTAPDDANILYYTTASNIYTSVDVGTTFTLLPLSPGGAGSNNVTITSIDITPLDSHSVIAVGTRDSDSSQYGGIYLLDENEALSGWQDTNIGNYDVYAVAFSPNFAADRQLTAVVTNETATLVTTQIGDHGWGEIIGNAIIEGLTPISAAIAFPDDHDATTEDYALFVAIDTGSDNGDVYMINGKWAPGSSTATDLDIGDAYNLSNVDVTGLAVRGSTTAASLLAGAANSNQVYFSTDSGTNWTRSRKGPTGESRTCVLMAPDFAGSGIAYAVTTGTESAFSCTTDGVITWNQIGLIDTEISGNGIIDLSVSPNYSQDNTMFMLTFDETHTEHSFWRSLNGGAKWKRVFTSTLAGADSFKLAGLPPQYDSTSQTVFLAGNSGSNSAIWKSTDNGQTFTCRRAPFSIDAWMLVDDDTLFVGSYDGSNGLVHNTTNSGVSYSTGVEAGSQQLNSIAISPNYEHDETILTGNANGWVYWSSDNGTSFKPLPKDATSAPLSGSITVAFDPKFNSNNTVYAASNSADKGIYRFILNKSTKWERIDSTLPSSSVLNQLAGSADGTLYATNLKANGGMERSLNSTYSLGPTFETVTRGLDDGATLSRLWLQGNQLWSIDTANTRLMTYIDSLALPVTLTSPPEKTSIASTGNVILDWETLPGATEYKWQLDYDTDFSTVPTDFEDDTRASSARLPALDSDTAYYWRVRATEPVLSRWSAKWSFSTGLGSAVIAPELYSPKAGTSGVSLKPLFQWSSIAGAESYELIVSTSVSFGNPTIVKMDDYALPATAWQSNINLDFDTTYYWKVRANNPNSYSAWSATGVFITESPPAQSSPTPELSPPPPTISSQLLSPPSPPPASPPIQSTIPDWAIYFVGALLLTTVILLITLLLLVVTIRRSKAD